MRTTQPLRIIIFLILLCIIGRVWAGAAFVVIGLFFITEISDIAPLFLCLLCFVIDIFFFLPFGMSLIFLSAAHLLFPFFRSGFSKTVLFFCLFYLLFFLFFPQFSLVKLGVILIFPILLFRVQILQSKMYELG